MTFAFPFKRLLALAVMVLLLVASGVAFYRSGWGAEWRLRRMSVEALEEAARAREWDGRLLYHLGLARARRGNHAGAAMALMLAANADPQVARSFRMLGQEMAALGRLPQAEAALQRAIALDPRDRDARRALGDVYRRAGALDAAIALFQDLLRQERDDPEATYRLAECYGDRYQPDRRLALLQRAARRAPDEPRYQAALGSAYLYYGRLADAERAFRHALRRAPEDPQLHYLWGRALVEHGSEARLPEAARALETAARLRPEHADTRIALGQLHLRQGDLERARAEFEAATHLDGFEDRAYLLLGQTYLRLGRKANGQQMLASYRRTTDRSRGIVQLENRLHNAPNDHAARLRLARLYEADRQPERAAYHYALWKRANRD